MFKLPCSCDMYYLVCLTASTTISTTNQGSSSLPVRGLLFQCSVCAHGGHQLCYRRYYTQHPMRKLPQDPALLTNTGSSHVSSSNLTSSDDGSSTISTVSTVETVGERAESPAPQVAKHTLAGQLCAAGCGHYCWATNSG